MAWSTAGVGSDLYGSAAVKCVVAAASVLLLSSDLYGRVAVISMGRATACDRESTHSRVVTVICMGGWQ